MPGVNLERRFLLQGSGLLIVLLVLWWFVLLNPLLLVLQNAAQFCWALAVGVDTGKLITEAAPESWSLRVPLEFTVPASAGRPVPERIHSVDFDVARQDLIAFTFSLPVYWAIILAAPRARRQLRQLLLGSIFVVTIEVALFLAFAEISAHHIAGRWSGQQGDVSRWFLSFSNYLVVNVIPYIAPFAIALVLHRKLADRIFPQAAVESRPAEPQRPAHSTKPRRLQ